MTTMGRRVAVLMASATFGCSSGGGSRGGDPPPNDPGACNTLTNDGQALVETQSASAPPAPTGGTIADGHYVLTGYTLYTGAGGTTGPLTHTLRCTVTISNSGTTLVVVMSGDGNPDEHTVWTQKTNGTALTHAQSCPNTGQIDPATYTATPSELTWYFASGSSQTEAWTLTRQ
jgi:hypothetical protein